MRVAEERKYLYPYEDILGVILVEKNVQVILSLAFVVMFGISDVVEIMD